LEHEKFTHPRVGELLEELRAYEDAHPYGSNISSLIRVTRRIYDRMTRIPAERVAVFTRHFADAYPVWVEARRRNDFSLVLPVLEKTLVYSREYASYFPGYSHIADPLIDESDFGMRTDIVRDVFRRLRDRLLPMVKAITDQPPPEDRFLHEHYPVNLQRSFEILRDLCLYYLSRLKLRQFRHNQNNLLSTKLVQRNQFKH